MARVFHRPRRVGLSYQQNITDLHFIIFLPLLYSLITIPLHCNEQRPENFASPRQGLWKKQLEKRQDTIGCTKGDSEEAEIQYFNITTPYFRFW